MTVRNFQFYSELVLVTVLSIFAANMWVRWMTQILNDFFPDHLGVDLIVAIVSTLVAIVILYYMFSDRKEDKTEEREDLRNSLRRSG
jgi:hypothetical protein